MRLARGVLLGLLVLQIGQTWRVSAGEGLLVKMHELKPLFGKKGADLGSTAERDVMRGGRVSLTFWVDPKLGCVEPSSGLLERAGKYVEAPHRVYQLMTIPSVKPSYTGAPVGNLYDPLLPRRSICPLKGESYFLVEWSMPDEMPPGSYETSVEIKPGVSVSVTFNVLKEKRPKKPRLPLYVEVLPWFITQGHFKKWDRRVDALMPRYIEAALDHGLIPYKHWVKPLESENAASAAEFKRQAIDPLPLWSKVFLPHPAREEPLAKRREDFKRMESLVQKWGLGERAVFYLGDEPTDDEGETLNEMGSLAKRYAPSPRRLVSHVWKEAPPDWIDIFVPLISKLGVDGFVPADRYRKWAEGGRREFWLYVSCVSHGCDGLKDDHTPDFVIDRPEAFIHAFVWASMKEQVENALYYSTVDPYRNVVQGKDPWLDAEHFTGQGDGLLFYPGRVGMFGLKEEIPVLSLRLKIWQEAAQFADLFARFEARIGQKKAHSSLQKIYRGERNFEYSMEKYYVWLKDVVKAVE